MPYFSVIIPVYNKEDHVTRCLKSVLNQTYTDFEIIVIDDASTDNSIALIKKIDDKRISIYHRDKPGPGGYAARNYGIQNAKGNWVAFIDADDEWLDIHLEKLYNASIRYEDIYFMGSGYKWKKGSITIVDNYYKNHKNCGIHKIDLVTYIKNHILSKGPVWTSVACIKRSSPLISNIFPEKINVKRGGDLHAWIKLMCYHKEMVWSDHIGAIYHRDSQNMVSKNTNYTYTLMSREIYSELSKVLNKKEKIYLKKYLNYKIWKTWKGNIVYNGISTPLKNKVYLWGDLYHAVKMIIFAGIPEEIMNYLIKKRKKITKNKIIM